MKHVRPLDKPEWPDSIRQAVEDHENCDDNHISIISYLRQQGKIRHKLTDFLFLTVCAIIAGADEGQVFN
ncbi:transposase yncI, partial [Salmonella enterica subsp. enterica serovar Enteritidis str. SARB17]